jgi:hypothetical protein
MKSHETPFNPRQGLRPDKYRLEGGKLVELEPQKPRAKSVELDPGFSKEVTRDGQIRAGVDTLLSGDQTGLMLATQRLETARSPLGLRDALHGNEPKSRDQQVTEQEAKVAEAAAKLRASHFLKSQLGANGNPDLIAASLQRKVETTTEQIRAMRAQGQGEVADQLTEDLELFTRARVRLDEIVRRAEGKD